MEKPSQIAVALINKITDNLHGKFSFFKKSFKNNNTSLNNTVDANIANIISHLDNINTAVGNNERLLSSNGRS